MIETSNNAGDTTPVFEFKSGSYTLPTLRLSGDDMSQLDELLSAHAARAPEFFRNTPVVIDFSLIADTELEPDLAILVGVMRGHGMVPIGIRSGNAQQQEMARLMELAILPKGDLMRAGQEKIAPVKQPMEQSPAVKLPVEKAHTLIIDKPVRSGQRVYARDGDLILMAPVSSGAEVMADGNIHAYSSVRGRILAGVPGNTEARIFCLDLFAELVSIAGRYKVNEDLDPAKAGRPVQVSLLGNKLLFKNL